MAQHPPLPETDDDRAALRRILAVALDPWPRQDDLAAVLGIARSALTQYLSGARGFGWHVARAALRRTAARYPLAVPEMMRLLGLEVLGVHGRWVPDADGEPGEWSDESGDVTLAHAGLEMAVRSGDPGTVEAAGRALVQEAEEAKRAALRLVTEEPQKGSEKRAAR